MYVLCMYVCSMYVRMYVCMYVCTCVCVYVCTYFFYRRFIACSIKMVILQALQSF